MPAPREEKKVVFRHSRRMPKRQRRYMVERMDTGIPGAVGGPLEPRWMLVSRDHRGYYSGLLAELHARYHVWRTWESARVIDLGEEHTWKGNREVNAWRRRVGRRER